MSAVCNTALATSRDSSTSYILDSTDTIRTITLAGEVRTVAGQIRPAWQTTWYADGQGSNAKFFGMSLGGGCVDPSGNLYVTDSSNNRVRRMTPGGEVTTIAGNAKSACIYDNADGIGEMATFGDLRGVACGPDGSVYATDMMAIRKITPAGEVSRFAGRVYYGCNAYGGSDGVGTNAMFGIPVGVRR
jgi:hypothetical protein